MKKEIPILFSTPMVQAILNDGKTVTRRIINQYDVIERPDKWRFEGLNKNVATLKIYGIELSIKCPYGQPGDILWVRETWAKTPDNEYAFKSTCDAESEEIRQEYLKAGAKWAKWKPSIHMPKAAARIWLQVEEIRVERLFDITSYDAIAEGIQQLCIDETTGMPMYKDYVGDVGGYISAYASFISLWESINGEENAESNPWVWVVKFKVLSTTGKPTNL